ncbi:MAG: NUDIX domain-containing protein [Pseudomonadota bacterium]
MNAVAEDLTGLRYAHGVDQQAGVLAYFPEAEPVRIAIVTSRRTRRWVFPKGSIDAGMTAPEAAAQEAFEEAGVIGRISTDPIGAYRVAKIRPPLIWTVEVTLYPLVVDEVLDVWIEADQRERRFVTLDEAAELQADPDMLALASHFLGC